MSDSVKKSIIDKIQLLLENRIQELQLTIDSAKESRDNETKSSVGDKYETGRAMMQYEVEKNRFQLNKTYKLLKEISDIELETKFEKADFGSLVITNQGNYFISVALGKIEMDQLEYFCLSLASPLGKVLKGKSVNDKFIFKGGEIRILEII